MDFYHYIDIDFWKYQIYIESNKDEIQLIPIINLKLSGWLQRQHKPLSINLQISWLFYGFFIAYAEDRVPYYSYSHSDFWD